MTIVLSLWLSLVLSAHAEDLTTKRKVIIDQDAFGPAGSNLQASDVEVLGITVIQDVDVPRFECLTLDLLTRPSSVH